MARILRKILKIAGLAVVVLVAVVAVYLGAAFGLGRIPVAKADPAAPADVRVFIRSNGVHSDLVLPVHSTQIDWSRELPYDHTQSNDSTFDYVGIGWGDKGFYMDTPTWAQLKASTALKAGFWLSTTAMHATFYRAAGLAPGPACIVLHLSRAEYARLIAYVQASFRRDAAGQVEWIPGHSYGADDAFYEANSTYSILYTCNTWTNDALKAAGQKASLWTPLEAGIFYQYGRTGKPPEETGQ
ncbi:TIGR02117 family protein [Hymenobacter caeli]|uniref:Uncharacterized protein (TIGR02117 family) n=1 Tax=Hymenobacter caeli TaxID=2735894 RepID=A0ABX2FSJ6_9BACT|nr:TIGR02117 family protein [Hymenobacter caeli]NRT20161.1 uncharacterized protein (TIGR02117 family) [Hymenobacter caeli]